jgi:Outer membrane protein beta-barrel domain
MKGRSFLMLVALLIPAQTFAQTSPTANKNARNGFWFNVGAGYGSLGCSDCSGREGGFSGGLALGGSITQKVLLGAFGNGWSKSEDGVTVSAGSLVAGVRFYPSRVGGFFLTGGLGVGTVEVEIASLGSASETGFAALLGLGYDFRVGSNVSLTPFWNGVGINYSGGDANFGQLGVGVTIH